LSEGGIQDKNYLMHHGTCMESFGEHKTLLQNAEI